MQITRISVAPASNPVTPHSIRDLVKQTRYDESTIIPAPEPGSSQTTRPQADETALPQSCRETPAHGF